MMQVRGSDRSGTISFTKVLGRLFGTRDSLHSARYPSRREMRTLVEASGIAFIHIPKAAGTSIAEVLYRRQPGHRSWDYFRRLDPKRFAKWMKFAVVRDPADRLLSAWDFLSQGGTTHADARFAARVLRGHRDVGDFVTRLVRDERFRAKAMAYHHFRPQKDYVAALDGRLMVNRLVPFARMAEEVPAIIGSKVPLPGLNVTTGKRMTVERLDYQIRAHIETLYRDDAVLYRFALSRTGDVFGEFPFR